MSAALITLILLSDDSMQVHERAGESIDAVTDGTIFGFRAQETGELLIYLLWITIAVGSIWYARARSTRTHQLIMLPFIGSLLAFGFCAGFQLGSAALRVSGCKYGS